MSSISMKRDKIGGRAWVLHGYKWLLSSHLITASLQIEKNESNQIKLLYYCCLICGIVSLRCGCINTIGIMGSESMLTHFCHYWSRHFSTGYASKVKTFSSTWDGIKFDHYPSPDWNFGNFRIRFWVKAYKPWYFKGWTTQASSTALVLNCACHTRHVNIQQAVASDCGEHALPSKLVEYRHGCATYSIALFIPLESLRCMPLRYLSPTISSNLVHMSSYPSSVVKSNPIHQKL